VPSVASAGGPAPARYVTGEACWRASSHDMVLGARPCARPMARRLDPAANMRLNFSRSMRLTCRYWAMSNSLAPGSIRIPVLHQKIEPRHNRFREWNADKNRRGLGHAYWMMNIYPKYNPIVRLESHSAFNFDRIGGDPHPVTRKHPLICHQVHCGEASGETGKERQDRSPTGWADRRSESERNPLREPETRGASS
jgi:hypothetical protein